jgi:hypothetical protein
MAAYNSAKKGKYVDASLNAAGAYSFGTTANNMMSNYFGKDSMFVNGRIYSDVANIFPEEGFLNVFITGVLGFGSKSKNLDSLLDDANFTK